MEKLIEIPKDPSIQVSSNILSYNETDYVFIPIPLNALLTIKKEDKVLIGTPLLKTNDSVITSPISGTIKDIVTINTLNGIENSLKIENDFEEKKVIDPVIKKNISNIKKEVLDKLLYLHFKVNFNESENLILNCIDDEPYTLTENFYLLLNYEDFLETLDKLDKLYNFKNITICVKSSNSENINKLMEYLGMYPNIKLTIVPNLYLLGHNSILLNYLNLSNTNTYILKASTLYYISNLLLRNRLINDKLITISGNGLKNPSIIKVKIGTKLDNVLSKLIELKSSDVAFIGNGLMAGEYIDSKNFIITKDLDSILIMEKKEIPKTGNCINCGKCIEVCPVGINPLLLSHKEYYLKVKNKCLKCGLCSYICPVYINFNEHLKGAQNE